MTERFTVIGMVNGSAELATARIRARYPGANANRDDTEPDAASDEVGSALEQRRLLSGVREGNLAAFEALYAVHASTVLGMALRRGCPQSDAEDVLHEVFMALWQRPPELGEVRLSTWLYRVTANKVASLYRRRALHQTLRESLSWLRPDSEAVPSPIKAIESQDAVRAVLARMSPKKREVLVLFELEAQSGPEIAEQVGCSLNTVWSRLHHARKQFCRIARRLGVLEPDGGNR